MSLRKTSQNRRNFIKTGIKGVTGALILPEALKNRTFAARSQQKNEFVYRTLGRTGLRLPIVSIGGPGNPQLIETALERGITHINTSPEYSNGNQEIMIGKTLRNHPRDSFIIATGFYMGKRPKNQARSFSKNEILESSQASLRRLGLEYVDIYYLMGVAGRETVLHPPFMEAMESLKKSGATRFIGLTAHQNEPEVLQACIASEIYDVVLTAQNFRKIFKDEIKRAIAAAAGAGKGIVAMKTQAGVYWDAQRKDMINMKAALKWVLLDENIHTAVPEFASVEELNTGISVMENLELTPEEARDLRLREESSPSDLFCQHCLSCLPQCVADIDIPTLMRSFMYKYGYNNPTKAREAIEHFNSSEIVCADCSSCSVRCRMGFDVRDRILDVTSG